ncbi:MAG: hypothetical protein ACE5GY_09695, partial [Thermodesulfobacteriota bacterium]
MTVQIKRGNAGNRPNPLLNGEFGWDTDTRQLWIGSGVANENLLIAGAAVTTDFSIYVCTTALGGGAADANGLAKSSGTATATTANKLVDSAASFDSTYLNKTVYNKTTDQWAKITAVDSATQLSLSADIMTNGDSYDTTNAFSTVPAGFAAVPGPYSANITMRISPGSFPEAVTFIGKIAAGSKTLTVQGSTTGTTTITGAVEISQKITTNNITFSDTTINANYGAELTWANCPLVNTRLNTKNGSDLTWDNCDGTGTTKLYTYIGSKNLIENTTITVGNNPENLTAINSTITKGYTIYVATPALGGDDTVADGLPISSGTATSTQTGMLNDSAANFVQSEVIFKAVYNLTKGTWAKVATVNSSTQLALSADIMVSGDSYVIVNAFSTVQGAVDAVPGTINCDTTVLVSDGAFAEEVSVQGKAFSGSYFLNLVGTLVVAASYAVSSATTTSIDISTAPWTTDSEKGKLMVLRSGSGGIDASFLGYKTVANWIKSNDTNTLNFPGVFTTTPAGGDSFDICTLGTAINSINIINGQKAVRTKYVKYSGSTDYGINHNNFADGLHDGCEISGTKGFDISNVSTGALFCVYVHANTSSLYSRTSSVLETFGLWAVKSTGT